jgi:hypothetical protein
MSPTSPERELFVQSALKWSTKGTDYKTGHPDLHQKVAQVFWRGNCLKNFKDTSFKFYTCYIYTYKLFSFIRKKLYNGKAALYT